VCVCVCVCVYIYICACACVLISALHPYIVTVICFCRNAAAPTVRQRLVFVGREDGKLLALRQLFQQVCDHSHLGISLVSIPSDRVCASR